MGERVPIYRNVLDDGTGNATISGSLNVGGILYGPGNMTQLYPAMRALPGILASIPMTLLDAVTSDTGKALTLF